jgi:hypothetical protein
MMRCDDEAGEPSLDTLRFAAHLKIGSRRGMDELS